MKKGFISSTILLLVSTLLFGQEIYRSNAIGMALEKIQKPEAERYEYTLAVKKSEGRVLQTLFHNGKEVKRWEREYVQGRLNLEQIYEQGRLTEIHYFKDGVRAETRLFTDGVLTEKWIYGYSKNRLDNISMYDGDGKLMTEQRYSYDSKGRLRQVVRENSQGERVSLFTYNKEHRIEEFLGNNDSGIVLRYTDQGDLFRQEKWQGKELLSEEETARPADNGAEQETDRAQTRSIKHYDEQGRLEREELITPQGETLESEYRYNRDGELSSKFVRGGKYRQRWDYFYEAGELIREEYKINGIIQKVTVYTDENSYYEELYRHGTLFMRITYKDQEKVQEEFFPGN